MGGEHDRILNTGIGGLRNDTVQFAGIDKTEALGTHRKLFHIDFQPEIAAGKIQDLYLVVPVMFD
jgi:hypothetical protein